MFLALLPLIIARPWRLVFTKEKGVYWLWPLGRLKFEPLVAFAASVLAFRSGLLLAMARRPLRKLKPSIRDDLESRLKKKRGEKHGQEHEAD